ncbi:hypothetical protein EDD36DRAFT_460966 [Exophiala viscosa]|uniref:Transcription factor domain-containing protein n=1 Tax=Exophiala viscosa TaxID=2486360 RepID=A0AAN6E3N8_9EURO|nr:hypothetical protein EDD36DRAFT_460966 [Exophiala viscosa]
MLRTILLARTAPSPENALALEQYARCLQYLMKDMRLIQDGINEPSDSLLIGTAALASHGELRSKRSMAADPRVQISPVAKTQNIDVYSSGQMEPVHMQAFYLLASQRGGLQACQLHGLADILEIIDLCFATRALAIPQFESRHTTFLVQLTGTFNFDAEAQALLQRFGEAFLESAELQPLHLTIHHMRTVVAALDQYVREGQKPASLPKLLQARNAVQYLLLSVSARKSASDTADCLVDMCRLGLLIFSNMVLFPLPTESGVAEMLVGALRGRLLESHVLEGHVDIWSQRSDLLTWIVTLGTMAATSTAYSQWYTQYLADMMPVGHLPGWHHLEETVLSKYAWWKYTCSNSGEGIWLESTLICERNNMQKAISGVKNGLNI